MIERIKEEQKGLIIIPDSLQGKAQVGIVRAVASGKIDDTGKRIPLSVDLGEKILFGKYSGSDVKLDGVEYIIMRETDILGVLHDD